MAASLSDLKQHLNITGSGSDGELTQMLDAAQDVVTKMVGGDATVTEVGIPHAGTVILRKRAGAIVSVTRAIGVEVVDYSADLEAGLLHGIYWPVTVRYSPEGPSPAVVRLATLIIAGHLWETQRGASPSVLQGEDALVQPGQAYAIPNRARELLQPYLTTPSGIA